MKNRWYRRLIAGFLCCAMVSTAAAFEKETPSMDLALGLTMSQERSETASENIMIYEPGEDVRAMAVYGDNLYGRSTMDYIQKYLQEQNLVAVGAINASFFDMTTGIPLGMVVTDGVLRTGGNVQTLGIWEDGSVDIGLPQLEVSMIWEGTGLTLNYNKALTKQNGFCLYSGDYDSRTKNTLAAYNVLLKGERDTLLTSDSLEAEVVGISENKASCTIPEGCFVLSLAMDTAYASALEQIKGFEVGDTVTIQTSVNRGWETVQYALGGGDLLVDNGDVCTDFTLDSAGRKAARTAIGVKANGDVVCYTVDIGAFSAGMTLAELADRMEELGCIKAMNLDGGGSTTFGVTLPGDTAFTTVNAPSEGSQRPCANFLFFVRPLETAMEAVRLHVYPYDAVVLPGGQVELTTKATDVNYMAAAVPGQVTYTASHGQVTNGIFTAETTGIATVTAQSGDLTGSASIRVVETPTKLTVRLADQKKVLTSLILETGGTADLTAQAYWLGIELSAQDTSFQWEVSSQIGTITEDGMLTAAEQEGSGTLTVSCGDLELEIPVVLRHNPFTDTKSHWARPYISQLYFRGILQGSAGSDGIMRYRPDDSMTRQEFVVAMMRASGVDLDKYKDVELPFEDADQIASWAVDSIKAAYELEWFTGTGRNEKLYADPTATVTREAAMTLLARTISATSDSDALSQFADAAKVSDWAKPALTAMVEEGIINGMDGKLQPQGKVTRAQVAKMLYAMN